MAEGYPGAGRGLARLVRPEESARRYHARVALRKEAARSRLAQINHELKECEASLKFAMERRLAFEQEQSDGSRRLAREVLRKVRSSVEVLPNPPRDLEKLEKQLRDLDRTFTRRVHDRATDLLGVRGITSPNYPHYLEEYRKAQRTAEAELDRERASLDSQIQSARCQLQTSNQEPGEAMK